MDVRNYVDVSKLMEKYGLGPNGAQVIAADLIADSVQQLSKEIEELQSDVALVDTSGQMELFAFRASGPYIASELTKENKVIVYLFDAVFSANPLNFVSNLFFATAIKNRFSQPQVHLLSKCDLLPEEDVDKIINWLCRPRALDDAIDQRLEGTKKLLGRDIAQTIQRLGLKFLLTPISAKTNEGMINFNTILERLFVSGDMHTYWQWMKHSVS